ncbi:MAG: hypothetical protein AAB821_02745, partial [Patescibacteria group bacterium]
TTLHFQVRDDAGDASATAQFVTTTRVDPFEFEFELVNPVVGVETNDPIHVEGEVGQQRQVRIFRMTGGLEPYIFEFQSYNGEYVKVTITTEDVWVDPATRVGNMPVDEDQSNDAPGAYVTFDLICGGQPNLTGYTWVNDSSDVFDEFFESHTVTVSDGC